MGYPNMSHHTSYKLTCVDCGKTFVAGIIRAKRCEMCREIRAKQRYKTHRNTPIHRNLKQCERCGEVFVPRSNNVRFCDTCKQELKRLHNLRKPILRCPCCGGYYIRKGNNQKRCEFCRSKKMTANNHRTIAFENLPHVCNHCGKIVSLTTSHVHHKDRNPRNNTLENLEILCVRCHRLEHVIRDTKTGKIVTNK